MTIKDIKERLLICTPSGLPRSDFAEEFLHLLDRETAGGLVRTRRRSNVAMSRNDISARAFERSQSEGRDLWLWVDDDEWSPIAEVWAFIERALERWGDDLPGVLVSGTYSQKWRGVAQAVVAGLEWNRFAGPLKLGRDGGYYRASWLPGGALLHSAATFGRMTTVCKRSWYGNSRDEVEGWMVWGNCLETDERGLVREAGEDVGFCRVAQRVGVELWLDTRWIVAHEGMATFWPQDALEASGPHALTDMPRPYWAAPYDPKTDSFDRGARSPAMPSPTRPPVVELT